MFGRNTENMLPRNGHTFVSAIVGRISGCTGQKEVSLDDQKDHGMQITREVYPVGDISYRFISTTGKGERLDRIELRELEALLRTREVDLLVAEDLGRIVRGAEAVWLLGIAVDHDTRVISPNDCVDTWELSWEADAMDACKEHVQNNSHTSKRIKFKKMNRFVKFGGAIACETFGYLVPENAKTYADWSKDPAAEEVLQDGYRRLLETLNCTAVADHFNSIGVPVGPYCRRAGLDWRDGAALFQNPILMGQPGRGFKHTVKHHETGRRVSVPNPSGPKFYDSPHLAFFTREQFELLNMRLAEKNANFRRAPSKEDDPLFRVPRKRTRFPGQHVRCWYCGREYVWGGNGMTDNLMCAGSRERRCWNSMGFNGELAAIKIVDLIVASIQELQGFESQFREMVRVARETEVGGFSDRLTQLVREEKKLATEQQNLLAAIADFGPKEFLRDKLAELDELHRKNCIERAYLDKARGTSIAIPDRLTDIGEQLQAEFRLHSVKSHEFGDLMRRLVPEFSVHLVRLCDGGHLLPRGRVRLNLAGSIAGIESDPKLREWFSRVVAIDLFTPPQREVIRPGAVDLARQNLTYDEIGRRLPEQPTGTAVGHALALQRKMTELSISEPYQLIVEPPVDYTKLRRHHHPKYRFEPLPGYRPPEL